MIICAPLAGQISLKKLRGKKAGKSVLDYTQHRFAPTIELPSLLRNIELDPQTGMFTTGTLQGYFLPAKDTKGNQADYAPGNSPSKNLLYADLVKVSGGDEKTVVTFYYEPSSIQPVKSNIFIEGSSLSNEYEDKVELKEPGEYEYRFFLEGKPIYTHRFTLKVSENDDPYSPASAVYTMTGDWEKYGLLQVRSDDSGGEYTVRFKHLQMYRGIHTQSGSSQLKTMAKAKRRVVLKRGETVIGCFTMEESDGTDIFADKYVPAFAEFNVETGMSMIKNSDGRFQKLPKVEQGDDLWVRLDELTDGEYQIVLDIKDIADRPDFTTTYFFTVKNGRVQPAPMADRSQNDDPTSLIEAGRDYVVIGSR
ncbi:MAG: hypothetical protein Roseis2KO_39240 [Roseivirga sp.]